MNGLLTLATLGAAVLVLAVSPVSGAPSSSGWSASVSFTNVVASSPTTGGGYPVPPGSRVPRRRDLPRRPVQREPLRVLARGQARNRGPRRLVEVLLRQVLDLLHVLSRRHPDPGRDAVGQQPGSGLRLRLDRDAGDAAELDRHDRPERRLRYARAASTRRCCRSTRSSTRRSCIPTARSTSPTATTSAATG